MVDFRDVLRRVRPYVWKVLVALGVLVLMGAIFHYHELAFSEKSPAELEGELIPISVLNVAPISLFVLWRMWKIRHSADDAAALGWTQTLFFVLFALYLAYGLAVLLAAMTYSFGLVLFEPQTCPSPNMKDFSWLVMDSLAKGILFDLMESFHVDVNAFGSTCQPVRTSEAGSYWFTSTFIFFIRLFSTYMVVWFLIRTWQRGHLALMRLVRTGA